MKNNEVCNECGRSVAMGSGYFVNRVPDLNDPETRVEMGKPYPDGDFVCACCDNNCSNCNPPRSFRYMGLLFTPWQISPDMEAVEADTPPEWDYAAFCREAKTHNCAHYALFLVKGNYCIPGKPGLFTCKKQV